MAPGVAGLTPPLELFPADAGFELFCKDSFVHPSFKKIDLIERKDILGEVLMAFENVYPFSTIDLPEAVDPYQQAGLGSTSEGGSAITSEESSSISDSIGAAISTSDASGGASTSDASTSQTGGDTTSNTRRRCAVSLGLMLAVFVATEVVIKEGPKLIEMTI